MEDKIETIRLHVLIEGLVQGVGFRYYVLEMAKQLGISGWVRNTLKGQVEVTAEGTQENLNKLLSFLRKGPQMAYVTGVQQEWQSATGEYTQFNIVTSGY